MHVMFPVKNLALAGAWSQFFLAKVAKGLTKALAKFSELCIYWANLIVKNLKSSYFLWPIWLKDPEKS